MNFYITFFHNFI